MRIAIPAMLVHRKTTGGNRSTEQTRGYTCRDWMRGCLGLSASSRIVCELRLFRRRHQKELRSVRCLELLTFPSEGVFTQSCIVQFPRSLSPADACHVSWESRHDGFTLCGGASAQAPKRTVLRVTGAAEKPLKEGSTSGSNHIDYRRLLLVQARTVGEESEA